MFVSVETANMCDEKNACIMRSTLIQCVACSICSVFTSHAYEHGDELARSLDCLLTCLAECVYVRLINLLKMQK